MLSLLVTSLIVAILQNAVSQPNHGIPILDLSDRLGDVWERIAINHFTRAGAQKAWALSFWQFALQRLPIALHCINNPKTKRATKV